MKLEKKHYVIGVIVMIILVWYFFLRKKKTESSWTALPKPDVFPMPIGGALTCANVMDHCFKDYVNFWDAWEGTGKSPTQAQKHQAFMDFYNCTGCNKKRNYVR
jgi:hypothetical protein